MSGTLVDIAVPAKKRHPIWLYYVEQTNMPNVFRAVFRSLLVTDRDLSLTPVEDKDLIDDLMATLNLAYPVEHSTITREFGVEPLRWNIYQRVFGYQKTSQRFPRSPTYNSEFHSLQESIFLNIARAIWTKTSTFQQLRDPSTLSEMLRNLREILLARQMNTINDATLYWTIAFTKLRTLLDNRKLIREKLGLNVIGEDQVLIALGQKFGVPVPRHTLYLFDLAERMETFLLKVERTRWDDVTGPGKAEALYNTENFFKLLFGAYERVWGRNFMAMAVHSLPSGQQPELMASSQYPDGGRRAQISL